MMAIEHVKHLRIWYMNRVVAIEWRDVWENAGCECEPCDLKAPACTSYGVLRYVDEHDLVIERECRGDDEKDLQVFPTGIIVAVNCLSVGAGVVI